MLPASDLSEILSNLAVLNLQPNTAAQILAAVLAPLLRSSDPDPPEPPRQRASRRLQGRPRRVVRSQPRRAARKRRRVVGRGSADGPRQRAARALAANPNKSLTAVAEIAGVSRGTVVNVRAELAKEARTSARKQARQQEPDRRERAQRFLREQLARGPQPVSDLEEAAGKAHLDPRALEQARADLSVVVSRSNTGVQAVTWSLPAP